MVGTANGSRTPVTPRQAFSVVNGGGQDPGVRSGPGSIAGSDCGRFEFTREEVEALLNVKIRSKDKFNLKEICEMVMDYIKKLRMCVRWFQEFEGELSLEHEKLKKLFESAEKKSNDMEMQMNAKEEELNSIIVELRQNCVVLFLQLVQVFVFSKASLGRTRFSQDFLLLLSSLGISVKVTSSLWLT